MTSESPAWLPFIPGSGSLPSELALSELDPDSTGRVLALVATSQVREQGWSLRATAALARAWAGQGERVFLADLDLENPGLHELLQVDNGEGISDAFLYGASVQRIARPVQDAGFFFASAGTVLADPSVVLTHPRWSSLTTGFLSAGVTLVLYVPAEVDGAGALLAHASHVILLAGSSESPVSVPGEGNATVLAVLGPEEAASRAEISDGAGTGFGEPLPAPPATEQEASGSDFDLSFDEESPLPGGADGDGGDPRSVVDGHEDLATEAPAATSPADPEERRINPKIAQVPDRSRMWALLGLFGVAALVAGAGWMGWIEVPGIGSRRSADTPAVAPESAEPITPDSAASVPLAPPQVLPILDLSTSRFSLALSSYRALGPATRHVNRMAPRIPEVLFFIAPVDVEDSRYYRVLAGPAADSAGAAGLARILSTRFPSEDSSRWIPRSTPLAFLLAEVDDAAEAEERVQLLGQSGIPAYVLELPYSDGSVRYRVYAGAYENESETAALQQLLDDNGITNATLTDRIGQHSG